MWTRKTLLVSFDPVLVDTGETGIANDFKRSNRMDSPSAHRVRPAVGVKPRKDAVSDDLQQCIGESRCQAI